jgi:hypothetical protein
MWFSSLSIIISILSLCSLNYFHGYPIEAYIGAVVGAPIVVFVLLTYSVSMAMILLWFKANTKVIVLIYLAIPALLSATMIISNVDNVFLAINILVISVCFYKFAFIWSV